MHVSWIHMRLSEETHELVPCALEEATTTVVACSEKHVSGEGEVGLAIYLSPASELIEPSRLRIAQEAIDTAQEKTWTELVTVVEDTEVTEPPLCKCNEGGDGCLRTT